MRIEITTQDINGASGYYDPHHCLVATALCRQFPQAKVIEVYPNIFQIDGEFYEFER